MDVVLLGLVLTGLGVIATFLMGVPQVVLTWRQTKIAERAQLLSKRDERGDVLVRIRRNKSARIGLIHYPPFVVMPLDELDEPSGLYVDLVRDLLQAEGIQPIFEQVRFSSAVSCVAEDRQDIVLCIFQTPRRSRLVDFTAFMHTVSVSGVVRRQENRVHSQSDLGDHPFIFVVCKEEIGQEVLEDHLKIPSSRVKVLDTSNVGDIVQFVATGSADIAVADSLSCQHGLAARGAEGPRLKPVLRRHPLYLCQNGVMIGKNQNALGDWLDKGLKRALATPNYAEAEASILDEYHPIIRKL